MSEWNKLWENRASTQFLGKLKGTRDSAYFGWLLDAAPWLEEVKAEGDKLVAKLEDWQKFQDELEEKGIIEYTGDPEIPWVYGPTVRLSASTMIKEEK